jgi:hypothetical protein
MEITGIVKKVGDTETVSEKFKKRDLILTLDAEGKYPQHISLQVTQDKVVMLDSLPVGSEVKCSINIRGREWTSPSGEVKYFNTLECWKLEVTKTVTPSLEDMIP